MRDHHVITATLVRTLALAWACAGLSCGGSTPTQPTTPDLPFRPGVYSLQVYGSDMVAFGSGAAVQGCSGGSVASGVDVVTDVNLEQTASGWRARPTAPSGGDFELRLSPGDRGPYSPGEGSVGLTATGTGTANNTRGFFAPPAEATLSFKQGTRLSGGVNRDGVVAYGVVADGVQFTRGTVTLTCNPGTVTWFLSRSESSHAGP